MTYSRLVTETHSTKQYSARSQPISMVVLHHAATTNADWVIDVESTAKKQVSSHCVVKDNRIAGVVPEEFRAWSLSDAYWDSRALTVECANESTNGWTISDASHESLAQLVADWSRRYGFHPHRDGDPKTWTVIGHREVNTIHGGSYATACPGGLDLNRIAKRAQELVIGEDDMPNYTNWSQTDKDNLVKDIWQNFRYFKNYAGLPVSPIDMLRETERTANTVLVGAHNIEDKVNGVTASVGTLAADEDGDAATIAAALKSAIPADLAQQVVAELGKQLAS